MDLIIKRLANLLTIKSIVTLIVTIVFAIQALREAITGTEFLTIFTVVIAFCFGTQSAKVEQK